MSAAAIGPARKSPAPTRRARVLGLALVLLVPLGTCLDEGEAFRCKRFKPCGGDPTGTWEFADMCMDELGNYFGQQCGAARHWVENLATAGEVVFGDGVRRGDVKASYTSKHRVPMSCLLDKPANCEMLTAALGKDETVDGTTIRNKGNCRVRGSECECTFAVTLHSKFEGPFSRDGVNLVYPQEEQGMREYCVSGGDLFIQSLANVASGSVNRYIRR